MFLTKSSAGQLHTNKEKEVTTMKYAKPEVTVLAKTLEAVRGGKGSPVQNDAASPHPFTATAAAYEADE
jgi:hypothetical protein